MSPWDALPDRLKTPEAWKGTDFDNKWQRWLLKYKGYFAYGPRSNHWWAKWRELPVVLFKMKGKGEWRYEHDPLPTDDWTRITDSIRRLGDTWYLSRVQKWCNWHVQLQWPLFVAAHVYVNEKPLFFYAGASRDADRVYWFPSIFLGRTWK